MSPKRENAVTFDRALALTALVIVGCFDYGPRVLLLCALAAAVSMLTELFTLYLLKIPFGFRHLDAAVNGVVLAMLLPPSVPIPLLLSSCVFAVIFARAVFGGKDVPVIPTAAAGYCFAILSDREGALLFPKTKGTLPLWTVPREGLVSGFSDAFNHTGAFDGTDLDVLTGVPRAPLGSASLLLLAVIGAVLLCRRSARASVVLPFLLSLTAGNLALDLLRHPERTVCGTLLANQTLFAVLFLLADPDFAPKGLFGLLYGLLSGTVALLFTRAFHVTDAPVLLTVLLAPLGIWLRGFADSGRPQKSGLPARQSPPLFKEMLVCAPLILLTDSFLKSVVFCFVFGFITLLTILAGAALKLPRAFKAPFSAVLAAALYVPAAFAAEYLFGAAAYDSFLPLVSAGLLLTAGGDAFFETDRFSRTLSRALLGVLRICCIALLFGVTREILGSGTFYGNTLFSSPALPILSTPPGGLLLLALLEMAFAFAESLTREGRANARAAE